MNKGCFYCRQENAGHIARNCPMKAKRTGKPEQSLVSVGINDKAVLKRTDEGDREGLKTEKEKKDNQKKIKRKTSDQG